MRGTCSLKMERVGWHRSGYVRPDPDKPGTWLSIFSDPKQTPWTANNE